jgi:3-hydroxyacyl-CoA dehydrogenase
MGRFGQKSGRGFYLYDAQTRERKPDPEVVTLARAEATRLGVAPREIGDQEIVDRCILALVNEGAHILQEGMATCAADIDVIWVNGYGFPRTRGGPMFHADTMGLSYVLDTMRRFAKLCGPEYWTPAPLLEDLASTRDSFASLCSPGG